MGNLVLVWCLVAVRTYRHCTIYITKEIIERVYGIFKNTTTPVI